MTIVKTTRFVAAMAIVLGGLAACNSGGGESAAPDNACELLTTEEADDLLGVPTNGASEDTDRSGGTYCEWVSKDSDDGGDAADAGGGGDAYFISVEDETGAEAVQGFEATKIRIRDEGRLDAVDGLGDDAYFTEPHGLEVRHGDRVFSTFADGNAQHPLSNREIKAIERRAAELVITRFGEPENEAVVKVATECARTGRCSGTRYHACDLLEEQEIARLTGFKVEEVDGASSTPGGGSPKAARCEYSLESPDDSPETGSRVYRRVALTFEPDAEEAHKEYRRLFGNDPEVERPDTRKIPGLGDHAFQDEDFGDVYVLKDDTFLAVSYEVTRRSVDEYSAAINEAAVGMAKAAAARI